MIYDRLFRIGPNGDPVPWIATSYKVTKGNNIKLKIRKGMLWHDGKPLTAEDVKFTFDYFIKWKSPYFLKQLANIEKVSVDGKYAVTIKLKSPNAPFIQNVLGGVFIIPKHIWQDIPAKTDVSDALNYANDNPVGSGPFKFDHWNRGRELKVSAFKKHFKAPKVDGIIRVVYGSHDAALLPEGRIGLLIEAAMAFGTGHHGTTLGCLRAYDRLLDDGQRFDNVLDLGCGTAVLAMSAARMGAAHVLASDIDPVAVEVALANVKANGLVGRV
ncbi:MAG: methyltransferase, partial [Deltaproteobacteria bacterium]|nr:methyltransferase [Deltaproteobacteria bacterium]